MTTLYPVQLTSDQLRILNLPLYARVFLEGPAGCGKTTVGVERLLQLMAQGISADTILLLLPQRTLAEPYYKALGTPGVVAGGVVSIFTLGGLARRMIDLFWPMIAEQAGFANPTKYPTFLSLETAQYYMAYLVEPLLDQGYFRSVTIDRNRLYSQIIDNLNKASVVGFAISEISERLKGAWIGEPGQHRIYDDAQECAQIFRKYCLENNLLDYSLQIELFRDLIWTSDYCRQYLNNKYRHLLVDNLEEDTPVAHRVINDWLPDLDSAFMIYDHDAGYRSFLGADPQSGYVLKNRCEFQEILDTTFVTPEVIQHIENLLVKAIQHPGEKIQLADSSIMPDVKARIRASLKVEVRRYYPDMLDWVVTEINRLLDEEGLAASDIVILSSFLPDALRFSIASRLQACGIATRSFRPSRALRDEPATQCLFTIAKLAHPDWELIPDRYEVAYMVFQALKGMDLARARLLAEIIYRRKGNKPNLSSFDQIEPDVQTRITYRMGEKYEKLFSWLQGYIADSSGGIEEPIDHFWSRLFGELLSQPEFGFHGNIQSGQVTANLVESAQKFRWSVGPALTSEGRSIGKEYIQMAESGVIAAQYYKGWQTQTNQAVFIAPAYTFLLSNRPIQVQFWLDVGNRGWYERLDQPLTHPYVLSNNWEKGRIWTDLDEVRLSQETLERLVVGLLRRCQWRLYLGLSEFDEHGYEEKGALLQAFQRLLRGVSD